MNFKLTPKVVAKNMDYNDLIKVMIEFQKNNPSVSFEELAEKAKKESIEQPIRELVYSNPIVEVCISLYESLDLEQDTRLLKNTKGFKLLEKCSIIKDEKIDKNFVFFMSEIEEITKTNSLYDFGAIQDYIWYTLYPEYQ